jgi:hypothetical protein
MRLTVVLLLTLAFVMSPVLFDTSVAASLGSYATFAQPAEGARIDVNVNGGDARW